MDRTKNQQFGDWWVSPLVAYDEHAPNLFRSIFAASHLRRQAIFASLALDVDGSEEADTDRPVRSPDELVRIGTAMRDGRATDIITAAYGGVPEGFIGTLERCEIEPFKPERYVRLYRIFADGEREKIKALRYLDRITGRQIRMLDELRPELVDGKIVALLTNHTSAHELNRAVGCLTEICSTMDAEAIRQTIKTMSPKSSLQHLLKRFLRHADRLPPQPFDGVEDDQIVPIDTIDKVIRTSFRYQNCLRRQIGRVVTGAVAYAEFIGTEDRAILEMKPLSTGGWLLVGVHFARNELPEDSVVAEAKAKCVDLGIAHIVDGAKADGWNAVARLTDRWTWSA